MTNHSLEQGTSVTPTLHDEPLDAPIEKSTQHTDPEHEDGSEKNNLPPLGLVNEKGNTKNDEDVLIVDWDGPDDPQNPKKSAVTIRSALMCMTYCVTIAGASSANGPQLPSSPRSHSSAPSRLLWLLQRPWH